jgi:hypothetical protein
VKKLPVVKLKLLKVEVSMEKFYSYALWGLSSVLCCDLFLDPALLGGYGI